MNIWMIGKNSVKHHYVKNRKILKNDQKSHLNAEDITDTDYAHAKRVCKDFKIKNLGEYHDLFVCS